MSFKITGIIVVAILPLYAVAQGAPDLAVEQVIEHLSESKPESEDFTEITEQLELYKKKPLDINRATVSELEELIFLSPLQVNNLLKYRDEHKPLLNLLEIQIIDGFEPDDVRRLMNFIRLGPIDLVNGGDFPTIVRNARHDLMVRYARVLQTQEGFVTTDSSQSLYGGSADRVFSRYRFNFENRLFISLNMEKDAGEAFFKNGQSGFDFYSSNIYLRGEGRVSKVVIGDFSLQFGQGLTLWSGLGFGKGATLTSVAKPSLGLRPYSSVNESSFLRGAALSIQQGPFTFVPFFSGRKIDASLSSDGQEISTMPASGLHRTANEQAAKNSENLLNYGFHSNYRVKSLVVGVTAYRSVLSKPLSAGTKLYQKYDFAGKSLTNAGLNYSYSFRNAYIFGEVGHSLRFGTATINGLMVSLSNTLSTVILHRHYAKDYHSLFKSGYI